MAFACFMCIFLGLAAAINIAPAREPSVPDDVANLEAAVLAKYKVEADAALSTNAESTSSSPASPTVAVSDVTPQNDQKHDASVPVEVANLEAAVLAKYKVEEDAALSTNAESTSSPAAPTVAVSGVTLNNQKLDASVPVEVANLEAAVLAKYKVEEDSALSTNAEPTSSPASPTVAVSDVTLNNQKLDASVPVEVANLEAAVLAKYKVETNAELSMNTESEAAEAPPAIEIAPASEQTSDASVPADVASLEAAVLAKCKVETETTPVDEVAAPPVPEPAQAEAQETLPVAEAAAASVPEPSQPVSQETSLVVEAAISPVPDPSAATSQDTSPAIEAATTPLLKLARPISQESAPVVEDATPQALEPTQAAPQEISPVVEAPTPSAPELATSPAVEADDIVPNFRKVKANAIPSGWRLATRAEVKNSDASGRMTELKPEVKALVLEWEICKLANGMKLPGSGYGHVIGMIRRGDEVGDAIVVPDAATEDEPAEPTAIPAQTASEKAEEEARAERNHKTAETRAEVEDLFHLSKPAQQQAEADMSQGSVVGSLIRFIFCLGALISIAAISYHKYEVICELSQQGKQGFKKLKAKQEDIATAMPFAQRPARFCDDLPGQGRQGLSRRAAADELWC